MSDKQRALPKPNDALQYLLSRVAPPQSVDAAGNIQRATDSLRRAMEAAERHPDFTEDGTWLPKMEVSEPVGGPVAFLVERGSGEEKHSHLTWPDDETAWAASHFGGKVTPLYTAPPSTAEVEARALEEVRRNVREIRQDSDQSITVVFSSCRMAGAARRLMEGES